MFFFFNARPCTPCPDGTIEKSGNPSELDLPRPQQKHSDYG